MPITADNAVQVSIPTFDFEFIMIAEGVFWDDDVDVTNVSFETLDGRGFSILCDGDFDLALEQWIDATVDAMAEQIHNDWKDECERCGYTVEYFNDDLFYP